MAAYKINKAQTFKIINIGQTNVGKSSILLKYTRNQFSDTISNTVGIDNINKEIILNDEAVVLQLWDTAGQERFNSIVKSYYRGVDGFIFVFDVCDDRSFEYIKEKIQVTREENTDVKYGVIVGNKIDLATPERLKEIKAKTIDLAKRSEFKMFLTSAKTGENITDMFETFAEEIYESKKTEAEQKDILRKIELTKKNSKKGCC